MHLAHEAGADNSCFDFLHRWNDLFSSIDNGQLGAGNQPPFFTPTKLLGLLKLAFMLVRIRWSIPSNASLVIYQLALAAGSLLTPLAVAAFTVAFWGFAAEFGWAGKFFVTVGLFSHWQVWLALAGVFLLFARLLSGYGANKESTIR